MNQSLPIIALTPGEPAGIGPELSLMMARNPLPCRLVVIADPEMLAARGQAFGADVELVRWSGQAHARGRLAVLAHPLPRPARPGVLERANAGYVVETLDRGIDGCLAGHFDALVTGPVHKGVINDAGIPFSGHTEHLARRTAAPQAVMLLVAGDLRVALATTHVPLSAVAELITRDRLRQVLRVLAVELESRLAVPSPRIAVCGLNPHAGEGGHLGTEERDVIVPVITELVAEGLHLSGPWPADTAFTPTRLDETDAVLAMYHDQGLPVLKHRGFGRAVNITLGLPIVRTSVDHGTALELAGRGRADSGSLLCAVTQAIEMAERRTEALGQETSSGR